MTPSSAARLSASIAEVSQAVAQLPPLDSDSETLYQAFKELHTTALGPFCTLIDILRGESQTSRLNRSKTDAINLTELFGEKETSDGPSP